MPERLAGFCFYGFEGFGVVSKEQKAACGGQGASRGIAVSGLGITPSERAVEIVGEEDFFANRAADATHAGGIVCTAFGEVLRLAVERAALFESEEIEEMREGIVGGRKPVGCTGKAGTDLRAFRGRFEAG